MKTTYKAEAGHWYSKEGEPKYTIIGANGKERNTTLRDAKKRRVCSFCYYRNEFNC